MNIFSHTEGFNGLDPDQWKKIDDEYQSLVKALPFAEDPEFLSLHGYQQRFVLGYTFKDLQGFTWTDLFRFAHQDSSLKAKDVSRRVLELRQGAKVKKYMEIIDKTRIDFLGFNLERIIEEETAIAFSDLTEYLDNDGLLPIDRLKTLPPAIRRAIKSIELTPTKHGPKYKLALWDKGKALSRLEQIKGMYRQVIDLQTPNAAPININVSMSPQEASDVYAKMIKDKND
jgi:hypothetical protein